MMAGTYTKNEQAADRSRLLYTYDLTEEHSRVSIAAPPPVNILLLIADFFGFMFKLRKLKGKSLICRRPPLLVRLPADLVGACRIFSRLHVESTARYVSVGRLQTRQPVWSRRDSGRRQSLLHRVLHFIFHLHSTATGFQRLLVLSLKGQPVAVFR